jgi:hypothetical protein
MEENVKCPTCVREGLRSSLTPYSLPVTLMGSRRWYDEDGAYHVHDPNRVGQRFACSNGHQFETSYTPRCPAGDYGDAEPTIIERTDT